MKKKLFVLLSLILLIVGAVLLMHSSYFGVKQILVMGNHQVSADEVIRASGIVKGENMFLLPGREVANRLLNHIRIQGVKLERRFPDTVALIIKERSGLGLFPVKGEKWLEVSEDGMIVATYTASQTRPPVPAVKGIQPKVLDKRVETRDELADVLKLLKGLLPWQSQVTEVSYQPADIKVVFASGLVVLFGHASDLSETIPVLQLILTDLKNAGKEQNVVYIDLRYSGKPVIREK